MDETIWTGNSPNGPGFPGRSKDDLSSALRSTARDAHFGPVSDADKEIASPASRLRQTSAMDAEDLTARNARRDLDTQRCACRPRHRFHTSLCGPSRIDPQVAAQVRAPGLESKSGQHARSDNDKTARERLTTRETEARSRRGVGRDVEFVDLLPVWICGIANAHLQPRAMQKLFDPQIRIVRNVPLDPARSHRRRGADARIQFAIVCASQCGIAEDLVCGVERA